MKPDSGARTSSPASFWEAVSWILNPLFVPPIAFWLTTRVQGGTTAEAMHVFWLAGLIFTILPAVMLVLLWKTGRASSVKLATKQERTIPLIVGSLLAIAAVPLLAGLAGEASKGIIVLGGGISVCALTAVLFTRFEKISLHTAAISGLGTALNQQIPFPEGYTAAGIPLWWLIAITFLVLLPLVGLARVRTGAHSAVELVWGLVLGLMVLPASMILIRMML